MTIFTEKFTSLWKLNNRNYVLIYCLLSASDSNKFETSINTISNDTGITVQSVRTSLKNLIKSGDIAIESTNRQSTITLLKYHDYIIKNPNTCRFSQCIQAKSAHKYKQQQKHRELKQ